MAYNRSQIKLTSSLVELMQEKSIPRLYRSLCLNNVPALYFVPSDWPHIAHCVVLLILAGQHPALGCPFTFGSCHSKLHASCPAQSVHGASNEWTVGWQLEIWVHLFEIYFLGIWLNIKYKKTNKKQFTISIARMYGNITGGCSATPHNHR